MVEIFQIILARNNVAKLIFYHDGGALPRGSRVLSVDIGSGSRANFECRREEGNWFSITGAEWKAFAKDRINTRVTLSKDEDEDFYRIKVR